MSDVTIRVLKNGPYLIQAEEADDLVLVDYDGERFGLGGRSKISLCSCGESENKPFCDGTHGRIGFVCERQARDLPPPGG